MMSTEVSWFEKRGVLAEVRQLLSERGVEGYLVGGYVRDLLLGRSTRDLDLVVRADAVGLAREAADRLGGVFVLLDAERRMARVVLEDAAERYYVDFATMRGDGLADDLAERDFTVNAMAIDIKDTRLLAAILDPLGGRTDLDRRWLRAVCDTVFRNDSIRLLRAVRLSAQLGFSVEEETEALILRDAPLVRQASLERIRDELFQIMSHGGAEASLRYLDKLGLLGPLFPELEPLRGLEQPVPHYQDVLEHSLTVVGALDEVEEALRRLASGQVDAIVLRQGIEGRLKGPFVEALGHYAGRLVTHLDETLVDERGRSALLKLSGLLHDVGKASTAKMDEEGRTGFFGHAEEGSAVAGRVARRLRLGNREVRLVRTAVWHHMRPLHLAQLASISRRAIYRFYRDTKEEGPEVVLLALGDHLALVHGGHNVEQWEQICRTAGILLRAYYDQYREVVEPEPLLSGRDLLELLGMEPGPQVGRILNALREAQAVGEVATREEALGLTRSLLEERPG